MILKILELIKAHWRGFLMGIFIIALCLKVQSCTKAHYAPKPVLPPNTAEVITVVNGVTTVTTPTGTQTVNGTHGTTITVGTDHSIKVTEKLYGFEFRPGIAVLMSDRARMGLSFDLAYYHQLDLLGGLATDLHTVGQTRAFLGICWTPFTKFSNTGFFLAIDTVKNPTIGLRLRF